MQATVRWQDGVCFTGEDSDGHEVLMEGASEAGGRGRGVRPMEMLLLGLGGCTVYDVLTILRKARRTVTGLEVLIRAERAADPPRVFRAIHLHYRVRGRDLAPAHVERAIRLSAEKYCSASVMLGRTARFSHDFELLEESAAVPGKPPGRPADD